MNECKKGVIVRFGSRGFGFLLEHATHKTFFVHVNDIVGHLVLQTGDHVTFEAAPAAVSGKAPCAVQVRLISTPNRLDRSHCVRALSTPLPVLHKASTTQPATGGTQ